MSSIAIRCRSLSKRFGSVMAVDGVDLVLARGRILALLGPSGCGKTTTLRLLAGFEAPDRGVIEIGGRAVADQMGVVPPERRRVGMVFQDYALFPHMDAVSNVAYGLPNSRDRAARAAEYLSLVGLVGLERRFPHELSGGQQQRVALARALISQPEVVLLDEPFSNLDAALRLRVRRDVQRILKAAGATAIFVTHDQEEALSLADEVALMLDGRIVQMGSPEQLYHDPASREVASFVGDADFLPGEMVDGKVCCELGALQSRRHRSGGVDVMLRPENLRLLPSDASPHRVERREFFGHDQLVTVRLASGRQLSSRMGSSHSFCPGDRVRIEVRQAVSVFAPSTMSPAGIAVASSPVAERQSGCVAETAGVLHLNSYRNKGVGEELLPHP